MALTRCMGWATPNRGVLFSLHQSADGVTYTTIAQSAANATHWEVSSNVGSSPGLFPAWFKMCAKNQGLLGATVTLTLKTDLDAP